MNFKHGLAGTPEYISWRAMIQRCTDPRDKRYARYGGRGITVCARWTDSVQNFLSDMGHRPSLAYSLERRDNDGPYSPDNCYWATAAEQTRNRGGERANVWLTFQGETLCVADWAKRSHLSANQIYNRVRKGWSAHRTLSEPLHRNKCSNPTGNGLGRRHDGTVKM